MVSVRTGSSFFAVSTRTRAVPRVAETRDQRTPIRSCLRGQREFFPTKAGAATVARSLLRKHAVNEVITRRGLDARMLRETLETRT